MPSRSREKIFLATFFSSLNAILCSVMLIDPEEALALMGSSDRPIVSTHKIANARTLVEAKRSRARFSFLSNPIVFPSSTDLLSSLNDWNYNENLKKFGRIEEMQQKSKSRRLSMSNNSQDQYEKQYQQYRRPFRSNSSAASQPERKSPYEEQYHQYQKNYPSEKRPLITKEMEQEVLASARATVDNNTISRAVSSFIEGKPTSVGKQSTNNDQSYSGSGNTLRDLASRNGNNKITKNYDESSSQNNQSWDTQQIAIASGITTLVLSPIVIPIIHSLLPPIIPFPSSVSWEGAALLGALAYIVALGDPADQSNIIGGGGGVLGESVEVSGAVSRIVGRTALKSVQTSAPRLKAAARAVVDYENTASTMQEMQDLQNRLSLMVSDLEFENDVLRREVALWNAVEAVSSMYKLEELKEIARSEGIRGYSSDGKNALLRRLVKEGILKLDLTPYYCSLEELENN